ncbi:MAG: class I SAM-dependent methyltransferase [Planctomycetota bacterium]
MLHLAREGTLRVLDVGAGPITNLGYVHPGTLIHITAIDALADQFQTLLRELDLTPPPVVTIGIRGEELDRFIPAQSYDAAYCTNALDHCFDPLRVVSNMLHAIRVGGVVSMLHFVDEGEFEEHEGLHQWDLFLDGDRPMIAKEGRADPIDLCAHFADRSEQVELRVWEQDVRGVERKCFTLRLRRTKP